MAGAGTTAIVVTGSEQVVKNLNNLGPEGKKLIKQIMQKTADAVVVTAKQNAPVLTGYLRSQISIDSVTETEAVVTSHADYSIYQKDDFMGEAAESETPKFVEEMKKVYPEAWKTPQ